MSLPASYNTTFLDRLKNNQPIYNNAAVTYKIRVDPVAEPDKPHWRVIGIHHLTGTENGMQHHAFCEVLDGAGKRIDGALLVVKKGNEPERLDRIDKPANEAGAHIPIWGEDVVAISVRRPDNSPLPSERVGNITTGFDKDSAGNSRFHHSFYIVFQKSEGVAAVTPGIDNGSGTGPTNGSGISDGPKIAFKGAEQLFENGRMIWRGSLGGIYVLGDDTTWSHHDPEGYGSGQPQAPPGLVTPVFGFGKVWESWPGMQQRLGFGREAEQSFDGFVQRLTTGQMIWGKADTYLLKDDGTWEKVGDGEKREGGSEGQTLPRLALTSPPTTGPAVTRLQQRLAALQYLAQEEVTGRYDEPTRQAIELFQKTNGLIIDGVVGSQTWQALNRSEALTRQPRPKLGSLKVGIDLNRPIDPGSGAIVGPVSAPTLVAETGAQWVRLNFVRGPWSSPTDPTRRQGRSWLESYRHIVDELTEAWGGSGPHIYGLVSDEAAQRHPGNLFRFPPREVAWAMRRQYSDAELRHIDTFNGEQRRLIGQTPEQWIDQYTNHFEMIVDAFKDRIHVYETYNEPDDWHHFPENEKHNPWGKMWDQAWIHPYWMAHMLESIYQRVKSKGVKIISPPLQGLREDPTGPWTYLSNLYRMGMQLYGWGRNNKPFPFDGIGYHIYVHEGYQARSTVTANILRTYTHHLDSIEKLVKHYEGQSSGKQFYISEFGWPTDDPNSEAHQQFQAEAMKSAFKVFKEDSRVALAIWFCTQDFSKKYGLFKEGAMSPGQRKRISMTAFQTVTGLNLPDTSTKKPVEPVTRTIDIERRLKQLRQNKHGLVDIYRALFLEIATAGDPIYNNASHLYDIEIDPVAEPERPHWWVIGIHHLTGSENEGKQHLFCDVLDETGRRLKEVQLNITKGSLPPILQAVDKPDSEPGIHIPMWSGDVVSVKVADSLPSERVFNVKTAHPGNEAGNSLYHHSFYVVFQRVGGAPEPPDISLEDRLRQVGEPLLVAVSPDAKLADVAQTKNLGASLSREYLVTHNGESYLAQIYERGLVYVPVGQWPKVEVIARNINSR